MKLIEFDTPGGTIMLDVFLISAIQPDDDNDERCYIYSGGNTFTVMVPYAEAGRLINQLRHKEKASA